MESDFTGGCDRGGINMKKMYLKCDDKTIVINGSVVPVIDVKH